MDVDTGLRGRCARALLALCLAGCTVQGDRSTGPVAEAGPPPGRAERTVGPPAPGQIRPNYKARWELAAERLPAIGLGGTGALADTYDDYRNLNAAKFFITTAPVTTGFRAPAE